MAANTASVAPTEPAFVRYQRVADAAHAHAQTLTGDARFLWLLLANNAVQLSVRGEWSRRA